jgi:molybdate transport system substrate-binding protein
MWNRRPIRFQRGRDVGLRAGSVSSLGVVGLSLVMLVALVSWLVYRARLSEFTPESPSSSVAIPLTAASGPHGVLGSSSINPPVGSAPAATSSAALSAGAPLLVYCAASNRPVMEQIGSDYQAETGIPVQLQFGGSQSLLVSIEVTGTGDLFLPADDSYVEKARQRGLIADEVPLARMQGVVVVAAGNPKGVQRFADLLRDDVRVSLGRPDAAAIGQLAQQILEPQQLWSPLWDKVAAVRTTVQEVAHDVQLGSADAGLIYDVMARDSTQLTALDFPELRGLTAHVSLAVLRSSRQPASARRFAQYVAADDKGLKRYREFGFETVSAP